VTVQPAPGEPYFEMEDAYRWFRGRWKEIAQADLLPLSALDAPPGYAELQEQVIMQRDRIGKRHLTRPVWRHFRIHRPCGPVMLAVLLGRYSELAAIPNKTAGGVLSAFLVPPCGKWRIWLYEHRQGRGWVCLDPADESHEVVRRLRAEMVLEALR